MKIAIVSDTHSRHATVEKVVELLQQRNVNFVIHCGDIEDAETVWLFRGFTAHFVWGNCDHDRLSVQQAVHAIGATLHEPFGHLELDGVKIGFVHGDRESALYELIHSEHFDYVFHGHTHQRRDERLGPTRVINVGALHRANPKTFGILDLATGELETVAVEAPSYR